MNPGSLLVFAIVALLLVLALRRIRRKGTCEACPRRATCARRGGACRR